LLSTIRAFGRRWLRRRRVRDMGHRSLSRYGLPTRPSQHVWPGCFKGRRAHHWRWCQSILPQGPVRYRRGTLLEGQAEYVGSPYIRPVPRLLCLSPIIMSVPDYYVTTQLPSATDRPVFPSGRDFHSSVGAYFQAHLSRHFVPGYDRTVPPGPKPLRGSKTVLDRLFALLVSQ
jgi:hypothetical protein